MPQGRASTRWSIPSVCFTRAQEPVPSQITWLAEGFELVDDLLTWCESHQLYLILDMHACPGGQGKDQPISDYNPPALSLWDSPHNRAKLEILEPNQIIPRDTIAYIKANLRAYERERQQHMTSDPGSEQMTLKQYNEGLPLVSVLSDLHFQARKQLSYDLERYNQIKAAFNTDIPSLHLVEAAEVPRIKSRPKRSILVIVSVLAAFIFTTLAALLAEAYRDINWENITH